jgi:hypothetical protein
MRTPHSGTAAGSAGQQLNAPPGSRPARPGDTTAPGQTTRAPGQGSPLLWAGALLILLVFAGIWAREHLGMAFFDPGWAAPIVAAVSAAGVLVRRLLRSRERTALARAVAGLHRAVLRPAPVLLGYVLFGVLILTRSSITVIGATPEDQSSVTVRPVEGAGLRRQVTKKEFAPARFLALSTAPFGRKYRVEASGYVPGVVNVSPISGRTLRLGVDIPISPAVHLRPSPQLLAYIKDGGRLVVYRVNGNRIDSIAGMRVPGAVLLGRDQRVAFRPEWNWELAGEAEPKRSATLLQWMRPSIVTPRDPLNPGAQLHAVVFSPLGTRVGDVSFTVRNERVVDVPLLELPQPEAEQQVAESPDAATSQSQVPEPRGGQ